jgi:hypothetical protein
LQSERREYLDVGSRNELVAAYSNKDEVSDLTAAPIDM